MKIRVVEAGFENYTGMLGNVMFENGVSVSEPSGFDVARLTSLMRFENVETGEQVSPGIEYQQKFLDMEAPIVPINYLHEERQDEVIPEKIENPIEPVAQVEQSKKRYKREELEAVADTKGIHGLREIAEPMGVKATSISKLIEEILEAQGNQ